MIDLFWFYWIEFFGEEVVVIEVIDMGLIVDVWE